ncbi:class I SAM-dependent methyltransferase [Alkalihalobacillus trypoxylicola]|uniref:SAM-dependent methyltransferase n=1 Tax=Alkalihalobacillus trypoxylicola TaxID=519424 RepID=A0A162EZG9_9BACI|nr:class I SAM-dependent methyltransferase [Alkalihalobacillus trypoxylicola]KYG34107.1 SAM-dependent methyltransferase [Alkalihalobacillus trypoxylicola]
MNELEYYNKVGVVNGWDFSNLQVEAEGVKWDFYHEVNKKSETSDILLDIGTGGGENIIKMAPLKLFLAGIDFSMGMLETAKANLKKSKVKNVRFSHMSSEHLQFPTGFFDVISACHAPFTSTEVAKVLKDNGLFLTQQVSEADKLNLKKAFGRGQSFGEVDGTLKKKYIKELYESGFTKVNSFEYDAIEYYKRTDDLIFLLNHTPIIPDFGSKEGDIEILNDFIKNNQTEKGICTNSKRFLIIANK